MKQIDTVHLYSLLNALKVRIRTSDRSEYTIPEDKLLLLNWGTDSNSNVTNLAGVLIQDGAGVDGNQQLMELYDSDGEIIFDAFFDDCPFDLKKRLRLIDNPFS